MQMLTANHCTEVGDPMEELGEGDCNPIGRTTVSTNLDPWELPETKPPTKEHTWAVLWSPRTYVARDCLVWSQWERMCVILRRFDAPGKGDGEVRWIDW